MIVWVLFVFMGVSVPASYSYATKTECEEMAQVYRKAVCVQVHVPTRNPKK